MEPPSLDHKIQLCYIHTEDLWQWIKENHLFTQDFTSEKEKWIKETNRQPSFFLDTELLLVCQNNLLLKVPADSQASFLAKTYQLECQIICQKLFQEKKNIIIVTAKQWETGGNYEKLKEPEQKSNEKAIVLFKDRESIEKSLTNWLKVTLN